jgi:hypothetical protein
MLPPAFVDRHPVIHTEMRLFTESVDIQALSCGLSATPRVR